MIENNDMYPTYLEKSLKQFEDHPYPKIPLEQSPKNDVALLYKNSLVTAYYHYQRRVLKNLDNCTILDVGCGTGLTTLILAEANPGARIVATDISPASIEIAKQRLAYHGFESVEFHVMAVEELHFLDLSFDYINASDILYLLPDITEGLTSMASVLKPLGIIRSNLNSYYARLNFYRAQMLFRRLGLMDGTPGEVEIAFVRQFYDSLKGETDLKIKTWGNLDASTVPEEIILMNYLFHNDKGFSMPDLLGFLRDANLCLIDMFDWREWQLSTLFREPDNLPSLLALGLSDIPYEEQLCLYELIQPYHRLLDFWCGFGAREESRLDVEEVYLETSNYLVDLHPLLKNEMLTEVIFQSEVTALLNLKGIIPWLSTDYWVEGDLMRGIMAPLLKEPCLLSELTETWLKIRPINPVTLMPLTPKDAFKTVYSFLEVQTDLGITLLESMP